MTRSSGINSRFEHRIQKEARNVRSSVRKRSSRSGWLAEQLKLEADQLKPEVDRLLDFVRRLQQSSAPTAPNDLRKDVDAKLIDYFETAAHAYVDLANKTITCAARHDPTLPVRFYYGEVLQE